MVLVFATKMSTAQASVELAVEVGVAKIGATGDEAMLVFPTMASSAQPSRGVAAETEAPVIISASAEVMLVFSGIVSAAQASVEGAVIVAMWSGVMLMCSTMVSALQASEGVFFEIEAAVIATIKEFEASKAGIEAGVITASVGTIRQIVIEAVVEPAVEVVRSEAATGETVVPAV